MTLLLYLGDGYLPLPQAENPFGMEYQPFGSARRMANGGYRVDHTASRWRIRINWAGLSKSERDTLWTTYGGYISTATTLVMPDGLSMIVMTGLGSWVERQWYDPWTEEPLYDVSFTVEQV